MASSSSLCVLRNVSPSSFSGFVKTFQIKGLEEMFRVFLLRMNEFLSWTLAGTASSQQVTAVLNTKVQGKKERRGKRYEPGKGSCKDQSFAVGSDSRRSVASFSRYCLSE